MVEVDGLRVADGSLGGVQGKKDARWIGLRTGYGRFWCRSQVQERESLRECVRA